MIAYRPVAYHPHRYVHLAQTPVSPALPAVSTDEWTEETLGRAFGFGVSTIIGFGVSTLVSLIIPRWRFTRDESFWSIAMGATVGLVGVLVHKPKIFDTLVRVGGGFTGFGLADLMLPIKRVSGCPSLGSPTNSRSRSSKLRKTG